LPSSRFTLTNPAEPSNPSGPKLSGRFLLTIGDPERRSVARPLIAAAKSTCVRAKVGFCNCTTAIDDDMGDRVGDVELLGGQRTPMSPGRSINVRWMKGHSRGYAVNGTGASAKSALSIAFHDRCDLIVATAAIGSEDPSRQEHIVLEFLIASPSCAGLKLRLGSRALTASSRRSNARGHCMLAKTLSLSHPAAGPSSQEKKSVKWEERP